MPPGTVKEELRKKEKKKEKKGGGGGTEEEGGFIREDKHSTPRFYLCEGDFSSPIKNKRALLHWER